MRNKISIIILVTMIFSLAVVGATLAYFTDEGEVTNTFVSGDVAITLYDLLETQETTDDFPVDGISNVTPGDSYGKQVYVSSQGSIDTYVRVQLTPEWSSENQQLILDPNIVQLNLDLENWVLIEGWYYYKDVLQEGDETTLLLNGLTFSPQMDNNYANASYTLEVNAEGIQATNNAINNEWGIDPLTWTPVTP